MSMIVAAAPQEATSIAESLLAPILALPAADRDMLLGTVDAWVANAGSAKRTTGQVYCHPLSVTPSSRTARADGSADADVSNVAQGWSWCSPGSRVAGIGRLRRQRACQPRARDVGGVSRATTDGLVSERRAEL